MRSRHEETKEERVTPACRRKTTRVAARPTRSLLRTRRAARVLRYDIRQREMSGERLKTKVTKGDGRKNESERGKRQ
jgi:hypothetical protein